MFVFHADDYGVNKNQCKRILDCYQDGVLRSVSILPNSPQVDEATAMLPERIRKSIHVNLVEGKCMADASKIPLLVDQTGKFRQSFLKLLFLSVFRGKELRKQAAVECNAQIGKILSLLPDDYKIRIDSHRHYHMVPAIFAGMCMACQKTGREIAYIRFPAERFSIYFCNPKLWRHIKPVNIIKILVLRFCSLWDKKIAQRYGLAGDFGGFIGLMFTTEMNIRYVLPILSYMKKHKGNGKGEEIEVLFHPGGIRPGELFIDKQDKPMVEFYTSQNRWMEAATLKELKKYGYGKGNG